MQALNQESEPKHKERWPRGSSGVEQGTSEVVVGLGKVRLDAQRLFIVSDRGFKLAGLQERG